MDKQPTYPKIFMGRNENNSRIYLTPPSWDCDWYWGFGYLGNSRCHYHVDGLTTQNLNLFDGIKKHFGDSFVLKTDADIWKFCELMQTFYSLKEAAEILGRGGSNYTSNPCAELIKNPDEVTRINQVLLPAIFAEIYKLLT